MNMDASFKKMIAFNKQNPDSKDVYKQMQKRKLEAKDKDNTIFCPSSYLWKVSPTLIKCLAEQIINLKSNKGAAVNVSEVKESDIQNLRYFWGCHLFGTWRNTLSIYETDAELASQIIASPIPDDTPTTVFDRLPEWCVYMKIPNSINFEVANANANANDSGVKSTKLVGFWALFDDKESVSGKKERVLNLVPNLENDIGISYEWLHPLQLIIEDGLSIKNSCTKSFQHNRDLDPMMINQMISADYKMVNMLLSLLLMLCAEEPDISGVKEQPLSLEDIARPKHGVNKKTGAFIPPSATTTYHIGKRLGNQIRDFNQQSQAEANLGKSAVIVRKRPHIRRGHWRLVWFGRAGNKQHKLYWQPPIFVNSKL